MEFLTASALSAAAVVVVVQEVLKLKVVPVAFANRYPVATNVILSVITTLFLVPITWSLDNIGHLLVQIGTVAVVASIAYHALVKPSAVRELEGEKPDSNI